MRVIISGAAAPLAAFALAVSAFAAPAFAQQNIGQKPIEEMFEAFGLSEGSKAELDYRERAPLVPPPSVALLPPPQEKGAVGRATGQWPLDPDEERRARQRELADLPPTETDSYKMSRRPWISPRELAAKRTEGASVLDGPAEGSYDARNGALLSPDRLRAEGVSKPASAEVGEPARKRLTDPPAGYRAPSGGVYAETLPEKKPWYQRMNPFGNN